MFITKFSGRIFGVKGSLYRLHNANGDVIGVFSTMDEATAAMGHQA